MYKIMKTLVKGLCCHFIYRVRYIGLEKIDNNKKYIICPNLKCVRSNFYISNCR